MLGAGEVCSQSLEPLGAYSVASLHDVHDLEQLGMAAFDRALI